MKKKVCVITGTRAEYGLLRWVMQGIKDNADLRLQIIATGMHLSPEFGLTYKAIEADGFKIFKPEEVFVPHPADIHTDHRITFDAVSSSTKWFRCPSVKRILAFETLFESDFGLGTSQPFRPNVYVDIKRFLCKKIKAMDIYASEVGELPFPRNNKTIRVLATLRGFASGFKFAEAFELLRERS